MNTVCWFQAGLVLAVFILTSNGRKFPENLANYPFAVSVSIIMTRGLEQTPAFYRACNGAIVSERHVFTSGRCVYVEEMRFNTIVGGYVRAGADILETDGDIHTIKRIFYHQNYDNSDYRHNVALIRVVEFFDFTTYINKLPINWDFIYEPSYVRVVGYTSNKDERHHILNDFYAATIPIYDCHDEYIKRGNGSLVRPESLCVARPKNPKLCKISPGAVLVRNGKLIGVLTYQYDDCTQPVPLLFTLTSAYTNWMLKKIEPEIYNPVIAGLQD